MASDPLKTKLSLDGNDVDASLQSGVLTWRSTSSAGRISFQHEAIGFRVGASSLTIYGIVKIVKGCFQGSKKERKDFIFNFSDEAEHSVWANAVQAWFDSSGRPKKLLVLVNPKGGTGNGTKIFSEIVEPLFSAAGITVIKQETQYFRHALDVARELDLKSVEGIVCVSGDGIVVEVLNGLLERSDWKEAVKIPIGAIPAGSGNGMAKSISSLHGESCDPLSATFRIIKGGTRQVDVSTVTQGAHRFHSVLNVTWGIVSDVDVESEKYRWMGGFRLTFQSLVRILNLRRYRGKISYLPANPMSNGGPTPVASVPGVIGFPGAPLVNQTERLDWRVIEGSFVLLWIQNVPWAATDMLSHPRAEFSDGCLDVMVVRDVGKLKLLGLFLKMETGAHLNSSSVEYFKVKAIRLETGGRLKSEVSGGFVNVDGEVIARGEGSVGNPSEDLMSYNEPFEISVQQGLATVFA